MSRPAREEIAWAAGLFEGEGTIVATGKTSVKLSIEMTDLDVLRTFQRIVDAGNLTGDARLPAKAKEHWRPRWVLQIYRAKDVERILREFLPWLHSRRREKAEAMLERLKDNPGPRRERTHCMNGHPFDEANTYVWSNGEREWRICRTCRREGMRRKSGYYERRAA